MTEKTYNGWTNYATWRVALEFFGGDVCDEYDYSADVLKDAVIEVLESEVKAGSVTLSYAMAFIDDVNWHEIAEHLKAEEEAA